MTETKVLYIITEYWGGMRPYAYKILETMWNNNSHVIIVIRDDKYKSEFSNFPQDRLHFINYPKNKIGRILFRILPLKLIFAINKLIKEKEFNIMHSITGELVLAYVMNTINRKIKVLYTVHDAIPHETKFVSLSSWLNKILFVNYPNHKLIKEAKYTITNSIYQQRYIESKHTAAKHFYSDFPSLITTDIKEGSKIVPELCDSEKYILFFGSVNVYKGVDKLCKLYATQKSLQKYKLVIAGIGDSNMVKSCNGIENFIHINRFLDDSEIKYLFSKALVVIYPYISATQSGVLSIASYFGNKMVLSDISYFREVAQDENGVFFFNLDDESSFTNSILKAIKSDQNTYNLYHKRYEMSTMKNQINDIYSAILNQN